LSAVRQKRVWPRSLLALLGVVASIISITASLADPVVKPPVPVGVDPGGVLIAIIGEGIDYINPAIAKRLARDGEGEIIGWDFVDRDRRPYQAYTPGLNEQYAVQILANSETNRLAVFRPQSGDQASVAQAIGFAVKTAARISFVSASRDINAGNAPDFKLLAVAAEKFPDMLFVAPAGDHQLVFTHPFQFPNVLIVTTTEFMSHRDSNEAITNVGEAAVDIAASGSLSLDLKSENAAAKHLNSTEVAAAHVTSLAARILAKEPKLTGADLKQRIITLAKHIAVGVAKATRYGSVADPTNALLEAK
jgi:subtilisin family serine protease